MFPLAIQITPNSEKIFGTNQILPHKNAMFEQIPEKREVLLMEEIPNNHLLDVQNLVRYLDKLPTSTGEFAGFLVAINRIFSELLEVQGWDQKLSKALLIRLDLGPVSTPRIW